MATIKKTQNGVKRTPKSKTTLEKISSTKLKDVPQKAKNLGKKVINKVKNTTVGDAAEIFADVATSGAFTAGKGLQAGFNKLVGRKRAGGPVKKKMKNGGSLSGLNASNKRDKGIDLDGAWRTVQKKALAGAKSKAKLTPDKQLGATKMAKRGMKISKKK